MCTLFLPFARVRFGSAQRDPIAPSNPDNLANSAKPISAALSRANLILGPPGDGATVPPNCGLSQRSTQNQWLILWKRKPPIYRGVRQTGKNNLKTRKTVKP